MEIFVSKQMMKLITRISIDVERPYGSCIEIILKDRAGFHSLDFMRTFQMKLGSQNLLRKAFVEIVYEYTIL